MSNQTAVPQGSAGIGRSCLAVTFIAGLVAVSTSACNDAIASIDRHRLVESMGPELAIAWNGLAYEIAYAEDEFLTFKGCAAAYEVATRFFGDDIAFENTSPPLRRRECRRARSRASGRPRRNARTPASSSAGCLNANIEPELGEGARTRTPAL